MIVEYSYHERSSSCGELPLLSLHFKQSVSESIMVTKDEN